MSYMFTRLIEILLDVAVNIFDKLGTAVIAVLSMDVGYSDSTFEMVFPIAKDFLGGFGILGMAILMINYVWQLVKLIVFNDSNAETPVALTLRTIFAGIFMFTAPTLIRVGQSFFATFYNYLLGSDVLSASFAQIQTALLDTGETVDAATAAVETNIADTLFVLIIILLLGYQYVLYLLEATERYVLLGILFYTSPLAFSVAGSKSTSNIFASWVKMVISQFLLMTFNVLFLRLFLTGMNNFTGSLEGLTNRFLAQDMEAPKTMLVVIWAMLLFGILYVGTRVDSYLSTLGLSAAQTGRGMGAALMGAAMGVRRTLSDAKSVGAGGFKMAKGAVGLGKKGVNHYRNSHQRTETDSNGLYKDKTLKAISGQEGKLSHRGAAEVDPNRLAATMRSFNTSDNISKDVFRGIQSASGDGKGALIGTTAPNKRNERSTVATQAVAGMDKELAKNCPGIYGKVNGQDSFVQAVGHDKEMALFSGGKDSILNKGYSQKYDENGKAIPGVFEKKNDDGSREELHNAGNHHMPTSAPATLTDIDGNQYWHMKMGAGQSESAYDFNKAGFKIDDSHSGVHFGNAGDMKTQMRDALVASGYSGTDEQVSAALTNAYVGERVTPFTASQLQGLTAGGVKTQQATLGNAFPEFKNDATNFSNISYDKESGNITFSQSITSPDGQIESQKYALVNSMAYTVDTSKVDSAKIHYTQAENGANYQVIPLKEGQSLDDVISLTGSSYAGVGVQHYENNKTGGLYHDRTAQQSSSVLKMAQGFAASGKKLMQDGDEVRKEAAKFDN